MTYNMYKFCTVLLLCYFKCINGVSKNIFIKFDIFKNQLYVKLI